MGNFTRAKTCPERSATCHSTCEKYRQEAKVNETERNARRAASRSLNDIEDYKVRLKLTSGRRKGKAKR